MDVTRRQLLGEAALGAGALWLAAAGISPARALANPRFASDPFTLGIASGDPVPDGVVLWTRLAPEPLAADGLGGMPARSIPVTWEVAEDDAFRRVVRRGFTRAVPELGHSVHVEVERLRPAREYFFRFRAGDASSPVGRTRTAPAHWAQPEALRLALASCQAWAGGPYASYRTMATEDLDLVVHVGDYTYEGGSTETLADFRLIHARYKTSPDLRAAHARFPFVVTLDDHEIENNWAAGVSQPDGEASNEPGRFEQLRASAFQAFYEHLPLRRPQKPAGPDMLLYRRLRFGDLLELNVLDTRQYRSDQLQEGFPSGPLDPRSNDPGGTMTGHVQERWLLDGMAESSSRWNVIAQQTIMAPYDYDTGPGVAVNHDQWDGYAGARERLLRFLAERRPSNPVVLTGDWHSTWINDLNRGGETIATEFTGTSISSGCGWRDAVAAALSANPHVKYFQGDQRGYLRCTVERGAWRTEERVVPSATDPAAPATTRSSWVVEDGRPGAVAATLPG